MNPSNQPTILGMPATVAAPYIVECLALLILGLFLLVRDGASTQAIINALILVITGNGAAGGLTAIVHAVTQGRAPQAAPTPPVSGV